MSKRASSSSAASSSKASSSSAASSSKGSSSKASSSKASSSKASSSKASSSKASSSKGSSSSAASSSAASSSAAPSSKKGGGSKSKSKAKSTKSAASKAGAKKAAAASSVDSETTEKSLSEVGGPPAVQSQYNVNVSTAVSAYARSPGTFDNYSIAGPVRKDADKSFASAIKQNMQAGAASRMGLVSAAPTGGRKTGRRVFVMRHGERMDRLFPEWLTMAITDQGLYMPYDMNMPLIMIDRTTLGGWNAYEYDTPVTEMGSLSGQMLGRGLKSCSVDVKAVYSSPSLRCVQTASGVLKTMENLDLRINIEPGLFEWLSWYDSMPKWLEPGVLAQARHRINEQYTPIMTSADLAKKKNETTKEYYDRVGDVTNKIVAKHPGPGTVLIVGHGSTMDSTVRVLTGKPNLELSRGEMDQMGVNYPYCSIVAVEESQGGKWEVQPAVLPQLTFLGFSNRFNPDYLNRP